MILSNDISEDKKLRKQTSYFFFKAAFPKTVAHSSFSLKEGFYAGFMGKTNKLKKLFKLRQMTKKKKKRKKIPLYRPTGRSMVEHTISYRSSLCVKY